MEIERNTQPYDLFKLIVALILLALLIVLMIRLPVPQPATGAQNPIVDTGGNAVVGVLPTPAPTEAAPAAPTLTEPLPSTTVPAPTPTTAAAAPTAAAPAPTSAEPTPTMPAVEAPTPTPSLVETEAPTPTPAAAQAAEGDCPLAMPARLSAGTNARVMSNLNLRASAGINSALIRTSASGTLLEISGGPVCEPINSGAYLWWQVRAADGTLGWSAEGSSNGSFYFLQPEP